MNKKLVVEVVRRLVEKGKIFEAEVTCDDWGISRKLIEKLAGGKNVN